MSLLEEVSDGRRLVTQADRDYVGTGPLAPVLLELISVARHRGGKRPKPGETKYFVEFRGLSAHDARDVADGLRRWRA